MAGKLVGVKVDGTQFSADTVSADFVGGVTRSLESSGSGDEEGKDCSLHCVRMNWLIEF